MYRDNKGFYFEEVAKRYLVDNRFVILDINFLCKFGEIDIISIKDGVLIFVEVKGRKNVDFGYPREYVTPTKIKKIIATANYYLMTKNYENVSCRFDVIEIISDTKEINHIENAFEV